MIVSFSHKFIFLKTRKTASTSHEIALSGICSPEDIITPIRYEDELIRKGYGYRGPQNISINPSFLSLKSRLAKSIGLRKYNFWNHMPGSSVRKFLDDKVWNESFKFCFERNPWDKVISNYKWKIEKRYKISLDEYINSELLDELSSKNIFIDSSGKVIVDKIYKFEEMNKAFVEISEKIGLHENIDLSQIRAKGEFRKKSKNFRELLSRKQIKQIGERFRTEIELLGFSD